MDNIIVILLALITLYIHKTELFQNEYFKITISILFNSIIKYKYVFKLKIKKNYRLHSLTFKLYYSNINKNPYIINF